MNTAVVKRKSLDVGKGLKSSLRKRQHLSHDVDQPIAKFVDDGSGDGCIVPNKKLCPELSELSASHTSAATSVDTGLVSNVALSMNSNVLQAGSESYSNIVSSSIPSASQLTSHTAVLDTQGTAASTSSLTVRPKITEPSKWRIQHLKFSSQPVASVEFVATVTSKDHQQATVVAGSSTRAHTNDTPCMDQQNKITDGIYLFWPNVDSLCWLDAAMALIVNCESLRGLSTQLSSDFSLRRLLTSFDSAQVNFRRSRKLYRCHYLCGQGKVVTLETSVGHVAVKTGGGGAPVTTSLLGRESTIVASVDLDDISSIVSPDNPHSTSVDKISQEARRLEDRAKQLMTQTRDEVFESLQPIMHCKRGVCDTVLIALSELLSLDEPVRSHFMVHYTFSLSCTSCGRHESGK